MARTKTRRPIVYVPNEKPARTKAEREKEEADLFTFVTRVARHALRFRLERDVAADVAQDLALEYLEELRAGTWKPPEVGLEAAVRNRAIDRAINLQRDNQRRQEREQVFAEDVAANDSSWARPDAWIEEEHVAHCFSKALERLSPRERKILHMIRVQRMSYREVANTLWLRQDTVCSILVRAQRELHRSLVEQGVELPERRRDPVPPPPAPEPVPPPSGEQTQEPWTVRTVHGLFHDIAARFRRELEEREKVEAEAAAAARRVAPP